MLQNYISRLRSALDERDGPTWQVIRTREAGYELHIDPAMIDARRFELAVSKARVSSREGRADEAIALLEPALSEWRGPPLAEFATEPFARAETARLQ